MGSSTIITHLILFIAVISMASGLLVVIKNYADQTESTFTQKSDDYNTIIQTNIKIEVISYDNNTNTTWIYARNTGKTSMKLSNIDVYIDGIRSPRNASNRTIEVMSDTDTINPGTWDPKEELLIKVFRKLDDSISHDIIVTTPYNVRDSDTFSI